MTQVSKQSQHADSACLRIIVFNPGKDAIFPVTSTIVEGPSEVMLVDAQFQARFATQLVQRLRATGKRLKYIYISHSDPDFYFGVEAVRKAFPEARVISTAQTAYLIGATKDDKLQVWSSKLGSDAPSEITVPEAVTSDELTIDGEAIDIRSLQDDPAHSYLWIPSSRTVLGGISVTADQHLWMADTQTAAALDAWLRIIDDMEHLAPAQVIAGHSLSADHSPAQLTFVRDYLMHYRQSASLAGAASDLVASMLSRYPHLQGNDVLEFGARVYMGESEWRVASPYPPIGRVATVDFGGPAFKLTFHDHQTLAFSDTSGAFQGVAETVQYKSVEVSPNVFMVYWHEPGTGSNVVHVQNWNTGTVFTNIAGKDGSFLHFRGTIAITG